jgi:hypothetical protein
LETLYLPVREIASKNGRGNAYLIMAQGEWLEVLKRHPNLPPALLTSAGKGPEGDAPLVLVRCLGPQ